MPQIGAAGRRQPLPVAACFVGCALFGLEFAPGEERKQIAVKVSRLV